MWCLNCKKRLGDYRRGLCRMCGGDPVIRERFPKKKRGRKTGDEADDDMSEAELEDLIAANLPTMPGREPGEE